MSTELDEHGQPVIRSLSAERLHNRAFDELIGMCRGLIADDVLDVKEARGLKAWLDANREHVWGWPANVLYSRLHRALLDDALDEEEQKDLLQLIRETVGGASLEADLASLSTTLPLNRPAPKIDFPGKAFCITGRFVFGARKRCEHEIMQRSGMVKSTVTAATDYLVVGLIGSAQWIHSTHGRKIEAAINLRDVQRKPVAIVSEIHWTNAL